MTNPRSASSRPCSSQPDWHKRWHLNQVLLNRTHRTTVPAGGRPPVIPTGAGGDSRKIRTVRRGSVRSGCSFSDGVHPAAHHHPALPQQTLKTMNDMAGAGFDRHDDGVVSLMFFLGIAVTGVVASWRSWRSTCSGFGALTGIISLVRQHPASSRPDHHGHRFSPGGCRMTAEIGAMPDLEEIDATAEVGLRGPSRSSSVSWLVGGMLVVLPGVAFWPW